MKRRKKEAKMKSQGDRRDRKRGGGVAVGKKEKVFSSSLPSGSAKEGDPGRDREKDWKGGSQPIVRHM